jgi:hypothetical protein
VNKCEKSKKDILFEKLDKIGARLEFSHIQPMLLLFLNYNIYKGKQ